MWIWATALLEVNNCWSAIAVEGRLRSRSAARYSQVFSAFRCYAQANGVVSPGAVTADLCRRFIAAPLRGDRPPCTATSRLRLTVLRSGFEVLVSSGAVPANPTVGLRVLHQTPSRVPAPLTPTETARLTVAVRVAPGISPWPATCVLALLGATHAEIAASLVADLDEEDGSLHRLRQGSASRIVAVPAPLSEVLTRRIAAQRVRWRRRGDEWDPTMVPLALARSADSYPLNSVAPTVSQNLARGLRHAGVYRPEVRPKSLREYAANAVYARTHRIEAVAEQLGMSSLDSAARLLDRAWQQQWGEVIRAGTGGNDG